MLRILPPLFSLQDLIKSSREIIPESSGSPSSVFLTGSYWKQKGSCSRQLRVLPPLFSIQVLINSNKEVALDLLGSPGLSSLLGSPRQLSVVRDSRMWCPHDIGRDSWVWGEQEALEMMSSPHELGDEALIERRPLSGGNGVALG